MRNAAVRRCGSKKIDIVSTICVVLTINIQYTDSSSGYTVLHSASLRDDACFPGRLARGI